MLSSGPSFRRACWRAFPVLLVVFASLAGRAQTAQVGGTLPEDYLPGLKPVLEAAVKQSSTMLIKQLEVVQREGGLYEANRQRWPDVGGTIRYDSNRTGISGNSNSQSRDSGLFYTVSADQQVFRWGEVRNRSRIGEVQLAIARKDLQEAYRLLATQIRQAYLELVWRNARLRHARYDVELRTAELATARDKLSRGAVSPGEFASRELELQELQLRVDKAQWEFDGLRRRLSRLSGLPDLVPEAIPAEIPMPRHDPALASQLLAAMLRDGGRSTFKAQMDEMRIREADLNYRIARVRLLPKFDASLSHTRESSTTATPNEVLQTAIVRDTFELRGSWTIFDGFATRGAKVTALAQKRQYERQLQVDAEAAMDEAQQYERVVALDARAMEFAEQHRIGAETQVKRAEEEAKAGNVSATLMNAAIGQLRFAEAVATENRAAFLLDWSMFVSRVTDDPALKYLPSSYVRANR